MSEVVQTPPEPAPDVALDRVMLAMDVVDTLRHQRALVQAELDGDRRQRAFVTRVQAIYESQGIEVPESVIEEGVRALQEDRFVYKPPERTFSVRLAEVYVDRRKWALWLSIALLGALLLWAAIALPTHFRNQNFIEGFQDRTDRMSVQAEELTARAKVIEQRLARARIEHDSNAAVRLLADAEDALLQGMEQSESVGTALETVPDGEAYLEDRARWDAAAGSISIMANGADSALDRAAGLISVVQQLGQLRVRLDAAKARIEGIEPSAAERARLDAAAGRAEAALAAGDAHAGAAAMSAFVSEINATVAAHQKQADTRAQFASLSSALEGVDVEPAAAREMQTMKSSIEQAMAANDWERAGQLVSSLRMFVEVLDQSYELRIVSRGNQRSGVWRYPNGNRGARNYYIVVEAIGADGKALTLPIESEEDQSTRRVRAFGIRVPKSVYEQVKKDKLDNGLIDNKVFGTKRRGAREPEYRFTVAGGRITRW